MIRAAASLLFAGLLLSGCATTALPPVTEKNFAFEGDEQRIWIRSEEIQESLGKSGWLFRDGPLEEYLNGIAGTLAPPEIGSRIPFRVLVIRDYRLNAFAFANGAVYVHTGILARMENEAQLAILLAHEMSHATHRHQVRSFRDIKNKSAYLAGATVLAGDLGALLGGVGALASIYGYSREMESEADTVGLSRAVEAGYDPREGPKLFAHMKKYLEEEKVQEPYFFSSHPRVAERVTAFEELLSGKYAGIAGTVNREPFLGKTGGALLENAKLLRNAGRMDGAKRDAERYLERQPEDPRAHYLLGKILEHTGVAGDPEKAVEEFRKAVSLDPSYPEPHRELGFLFFKKGDRAGAKEHLERYLALDPKAPDRGYAEKYLRSLK